MCIQLPYKCKAALCMMFVCFFLQPALALGRKDIKPETGFSGMRIVSETVTHITFQESDGRIVTVPKNPKRAVICYASAMDLWYMAGGTSLARVAAEFNISDEAQKLPCIGSYTALNTELLLELKPDFLIFAKSGTQAKARDFFDSEGIPSLGITYNSYDDFLIILDLFTRLNARPGQYVDIVSPIQRQVHEIIRRVPQGAAPRVCILLATTTHIKIETSSTTTGDFVKRLGACNIYAGKEGETRVDISLEYILAQDPDIILVTTMGDVEKCKARMQADMIDTSVWSELRAVKEGRWFYVDKAYSTYKPNRFYPEAFKIIAELLYPSVKFSYTDTKTQY